jgi:hypothetical protein
MVVDKLTALPAAVRDIPTLLRLWEKAFSHEYGLLLPAHAALRLHERLLALPSGLDDFLPPGSLDDARLLDRRRRSRLRCRPYPVAQHNPGIANTFCIQRVTPLYTGAIRMYGIYAHLPMIVLRRGHLVCRCQQQSDDEPAGRG